MKNKIRIASIISSVALLICLGFTLCDSLIDNTPNWLSTTAIIISNQFVSGIIIAIATIFIVFDIQISIAKKGVKKDFRCQEILSDNYNDIHRFSLLYNNNPIPKRQEKESEIKYNERLKKYYKDFCVANKSDIKFLYEELSSEENNILFDTLKISMFFNLNFKLISIINNIYNRIPNFTKRNVKARDYFEGKSSDIDDNDAYIIMLDLKFLISYWNDLFDYLKYDDIETQVLLEYHNKIFNNPKFESLERRKFEIYTTIKAYKKEMKNEVKRRRSIKNKK